MVIKLVKVIKKWAAGLRESFHKFFTSPVCLEVRKRLLALFSLGAQTAFPVAVDAASSNVSRHVDKCNQCGLIQPSIH